MSVYNIDDIVIDDIVLENIAIRRVIVENAWSIQRDIPTFHNDIICDITLSKDTIHTITKLVRDYIASSSTSATYSNDILSKIECYNPTLTKKLDGNTLVDYTSIIGRQVISKTIPVSKLPTPRNMRLRGKFRLAVLIITEQDNYSKDVLGFIVRDVYPVANSLAVQSQVWV